MHLFPLKLPETTIDIRNSDLLLRSPSLDDFEAWRVVREESREFLTPWEPIWPKDDLTRTGYRRRLRGYKNERQMGTGETFFLIDLTTGKPIGGLSISNIRRGVSLSCGIGYWMAEKRANQGHMSAALKQTVQYIFHKLNLQRIEAACLPNNNASIRLLENTGFIREGFLRKYLNINGERRDHILYSFLFDDHLVGK